MNTIGQLREESIRALASIFYKESERALARCAEEVDALLSSILKKDRAYILSHREEKIEKEIEDSFRQLLKRRMGEEPLEYILNTCSFYSLDFYVEPSVLIPRPETECLVDYALKRLNSETHFDKVIDVGAGSGAICVSIGANRKDSSEKIFANGAKH